MKRSFIWLVGVRIDATFHDACVHSFAMEVSVSSVVQEKPPLLLIRTSNDASDGPPMANQRQYFRTGWSSPARLIIGLVRVTQPASTSDCPAVPPELPAPVTKHLSPNSEVWSSGGSIHIPCHFVPQGSCRTQRPLFASPDWKRTHPSSVSASSAKYTGWIGISCHAAGAPAGWTPTFPPASTARK